MLAWRLLKKLSDALEIIIRISIISSMGGIVLFVNLAVFFRYVLADPLTWTNEISSYLLVFSVLFGASLGLRYNQFVKVEALSNLLPPRARLFVMIGSQVLIALFLIVCIGSPSLLIQKAIITRTISPAIGIPMAQLYRLLRIGFACMLFFVSINTIEYLLDRGLARNAREKSQ
ncbi:MAG: TRAP transporter small permease subunit [Proteobacteria bacterium]|nr:TRAP transporter small permease subunit [Pseudomonadota bacterium]NIS70208.1 TRAP transporter small permease subunit [Pseudomonadota bacterium]